MGSTADSPRDGTSKTSGSRRRSLARLAAVQILYEMEMAGAAADGVLREFLADRWGQDSANADSEFLISLVRGAADRRAEVDGMIEAALSAEWTIERLEMVLLAILRTGTYELLTRIDIPPRVVITEYVDVAHAFFAGNEPGFVNGVLDRLAHTLRPGELEAIDSEPDR